jgi:chaperone required for assembly of F1-ATPase
MREPPPPGEGSKDPMRAANVDEDFQAERWGADVEAISRREARWREFEAAAIAVKLAGHS